MLRIYRCKSNELDPKVTEFSFVAEQWEQELQSQLPLEYSSVIARPVIQGEYVNFLTPLTGEIIRVTDSNKAQYANAIALLNRRKEAVYNFLKSDKPLNNTALESSRALFAFIVGHSENIFVLQNNNPVSVPVKVNLEPEWEKVAPVVMAPTKRGCLVPFLLLLLLLLLLLACLWWFLLRPWPMEGTLQDRINSWFNDNKPVAEQVVEDPTPAVDPNKAKEDENLKAQAEADRLKAEEEAKLKAEEEAKLKAEEEAKLKAEEEAAKLKAEEEAAKLKAAEEAAKLKAEKEAKLKADKLKAEAEAKALAAKKAEEAKKAKADALKNSKKIPKCKTLEEEGKMPQMAIAFDGSESMLLQYGFTNRLKAAQQAATDLVNTIDKKVNIGLVEINGCPMSKPRGFFDGNSRGRLLSAIKSINPHAYDGKTPLVDGLNELSKMLDGKNADAVGILISDGEDTCPFTANMDVCAVATKIHQRQPRLKIHTILIGDSIDSAACIARNTGGLVFKPKDASQIQTQLKQAGASLKKVCED